MIIDFQLKNLKEIDKVATSILNSFEGYKIFTLIGDLGAGKTTLTQAFCRVLNVEDEVVSPTYTIINEYVSRDGLSVYHSDLYRINSLQEAIDTGIEDYLFSQNYCFVEWPQIIKPILPFKFVNLEIKNNFDGSRTITAISHG